MNKKLIYVLIIIGVLIAIYFGHNKYTNNKRKNKDKKLFEMWNSIAKSKGKTIDEEKVMNELSKLQEKDIDWLTTFTTKVSSSTNLMDYLALGGDLTTLTKIIEKTDLKEMLTAIVFPNILGRTDGENKYLGK